MSEPLRVTIVPTIRNPKQRYRAYLLGELLPIVSDSADPEHDVCRALLDRGLDGPVTFYTPSGTPSMVLDVRKGAGRTVRENDRVGPTLRKYAPFASSAVAVAASASETGV